LRNNNYKIKKSKFIECTNKNSNSKL
jgi:hypothetical protein